MQSINESAKSIVDVIGVIDGIAFQTKAPAARPVRQLATSTGTDWEEF